jgi:hypothetical protein
VSSRRRPFQLWDIQSNPWLRRQPLTTAAKPDAKRSHLADEPCSVRGCPEPRHVTASGYVESRCQAHCAQEARERYARRPKVLAGRRTAYASQRAERAD